MENFKILTREETAKLLHCHVNTVSNLEKAGKIEGKRLGRKVYFTESSIKKAFGE